MITFSITAKPGVLVRVFSAGLLKRQRESEASFPFQAPGSEPHGVDPGRFPCVDLLRIARQGL